MVFFALARDDRQIRALGVFVGDFGKNDEVRKLVGLEDVFDALGVKASGDERRDVLTAGAHFFESILKQNLIALFGERVETRRGGKRIEDALGFQAFVERDVVFCCQFL